MKRMILAGCIGLTFYVGVVYAQSRVAHPHVLRVWNDYTLVYEGRGYDGDFHAPWGNTNYYVEVECNGEVK